MLGDNQGSTQPTNGLLNDISVYEEMEDPEESVDETEEKSTEKTPPDEVIEKIAAKEESSENKKPTEEDPKGEGEDKEAAKETSTVEEIDFEGEKYNVKDLVSRYRAANSMQADYTRKTQALARTRDEFNSEKQAEQEKIDKFYKDPEFLLKTLQRKAPEVLEATLTKYYEDLQYANALYEKDPALYEKYLQQKNEEADLEERIEKSRQEEKIKAIKAENERTESIKNNIQTIGPKLLKKYNLLGEQVDKEYMWGVFMDRLKLAHKNTELTTDSMTAVVKAMSEDLALKSYVSSLDAHEKTDPKKKLEPTIKSSTNPKQRESETKYKDPSDVFKRHTIWDQ